MAVVAMVARLPSQEFFLPEYLSRLVASGYQMETKRHLSQMIADGVAGLWRA